MTIYPPHRNRQWRLTPNLQSPNRQWRFTPPRNRQWRLTPNLQSPNRQWRFAPPPKSYLPISCVKLEDGHCAKDPFTGRSISRFPYCPVERLSRSIYSWGIFIFNAIQHEHIVIIKVLWYQQRTDLLKVRFVCSLIRDVKAYNTEKLIYSVFFVVQIWSLSRMQEIKRRLWTKGRPEWLIFHQ